MRKLTSINLIVLFILLPIISSANDDDNDVLEIAIEIESASSLAVNIPNQINNLPPPQIITPFDGALTQKIKADGFNMNARRLLELLQIRNIGINVTDQNGNTLPMALYPITSIGMKTWQYIAGVFLDAGGNPQIANHDNDTLLHFISAHNVTKPMRLLLERILADSKINIDAQNKLGNTALHNLAQHYALKLQKENKKIDHQLLQALVLFSTYNADFDLSNKQGETPRQLLQRKNQNIINELDNSNKKRSEHGLIFNQNTRKRCAPLSTQSIAQKKVKTTDSTDEHTIQPTEEQRHRIGFLVDQVLMNQRNINFLGLNPEHIGEAYPYPTEHNNHTINNRNNADDPAVENKDGTNERESNLINLPSFAELNTILHNHQTHDIETLQLPALNVTVNRLKHPYCLLNFES